MAGRRLPELAASGAERQELASRASRRSTAQALALRARVVLACATGAQNQDVAAELGVCDRTVGKRRRRSLEQRPDGPLDEPRPGAPRSVDDARIEAVVVRTLESVPPDATHWSPRGMARASGLSVSTVRRIRRAFGLQPHRLEAFKLSTDPDFVTKVRDVVGFCMAPPERAPVLCVDEKSQIQALDRSQPMLPMRPGQPARRSHDYKRHGTTSLLAKRPRWHVHLTPTSASWPNQVERFFTHLTDKSIRRGVHRSVADLQAAIAGFIEQHNAAPKPFRWTKSADDILAGVERFCLRQTPAPR